MLDLLPNYVHNGYRNDLYIDDFAHVLELHFGLRELDCFVFATYVPKTVWCAGRKSSFRLTYERSIYLRNWAMGYGYSSRCLPATSLRVNFRNSFVDKWL